MENEQLEIVLTVDNYKKIREEIKEINQIIYDLGRKLAWLKRLESNYEIREK